MDEEKERSLGRLLNTIRSGDDGPSQTQAHKHYKAALGDPDSQEDRQATSHGDPDPYKPYGSRRRQPDHWHVFPGI